MSAAEKIPDIELKGGARVAPPVQPAPAVQLAARRQDKIKDNWFGRHRRLMLVSGPLLVAIAGGVFWLFGGRYMSTDDAYVEAARVEISSNVPGRVVEVDVKDNQLVHKGDVLFRLDDRPFKIAVEDAQARLAAARLEVKALEATYQQRLADAQAARDTLAYEQREYQRQVKLAQSGIASQAMLDQARHALDNAQQQLAATGQQTANVLANLGGDLTLPVDRHPGVEAAQAELDRAELNLSYATTAASTDGIVTKVEQLQVGDYINAAAPVFALVSNHDIWVEANFKETELTYMKPGQKAKIYIDTYPGKVFHGRVASSSPGTGSTFSLLPPENASGNWVKIVQRLPVRISIDDAGDLPMLHAGMSATVEVDTGHSRLHAARDERQ